MKKMVPKFVAFFCYASQSHRERRRLVSNTHWSFTWTHTHDMFGEDQSIAFAIETERVRTYELLEEISDQLLFSFVFQALHCSLTSCLRSTIKLHDASIGKVNMNGVIQDVMIKKIVTESNTTASRTQMTVHVDFENKSNDCGGLE